MKDVLGKRIRSGTKIVYATRKGSSMSLRPTTVVSEGRDGLVVKNPNWSKKATSRTPRTVTLTNSAFVAVVA
jgi:hypothetical protein